MFRFSFVWFPVDLINDVIIKGLSLGEVGKGIATFCGVLLCMIIAYLLGSLNFGIILSKKMYHEDIRNSGSGNAGTTNMLRTYGKKAAILTLLLDMLKGGVAVVIGALILKANGSVDGAAIAGLFAVIGHMFPCFFAFKGGKGVATTAMIMLLTRPLIFLIVLVAFLIIVIGTKYVSLGSVVCAMLFPILLYRLDTSYVVADPTLYGDHGWLTLSFMLIMVLVVFMHRSNLKRLWAGKESKISFGKKKNDEQK